MKIKNILILIFCLALNVYINSMSNQELMRGARKDDIDLVNQALKEGADINIKSFYGDTALIEAARYSYENMIKLLINAKADPNIGGWFKETPLFFAVRNSKKNLVELLINLKADLNIKNRDNDTVLMFVAQDGDDENIVEILLNAKADLDLVDNDNKTALDIAKVNKHSNIEKLIKNEYEIRRQTLFKEIIKANCLLPDLAEIVSEYAVYPKPEKVIGEFRQE